MGLSIIFRVNAHQNNRMFWIIMLDERDGAVLTPVALHSAPASWPPAADCYSSLPPLARQWEELQRWTAAPQVRGPCLAKALATSRVQWGPPTGPEPKRGLWIPISAPAEQLHLLQIHLQLLCRITPLRTHNCQVKALSVHFTGMPCEIRNNKWTYTVTYLLTSVFHVL